MALVLAPLFAGTALFGFNATVLTLVNNGLGDAIGAVKEHRAASLTGAPAPFEHSYSEISALDGLVAGMVLYFSALVDAAPSANVLLFYVWGMAQFCAAWTVLVLEGRRNGNKGRAVAWVSVMGVMFQNLSWTFTAPLYLALHLLTSPVASLKKSDDAAAKRKALLVRENWDLTVLPLSVVLAFVVPAVLMSFPEFFGHDAKTHYLWLAFWQPFPLWNVWLIFAFTAVSKALFGNETVAKNESERFSVAAAKQYLASVHGVYVFALLLCVATHVPILVLTLLPLESRASLLSSLPRSLTKLVNLSSILDANVSFVNTFVPFPWYAAPVIGGTNYAPGDLAPLAVHFIHYDFYCGTIPFLVWAMYLHQRMVNNDTLISLLGKTVVWTVVGGPAAAATVLLWERDGVVLEGGDASESQKTK
ncbi:hypothetical protein F5Y16DRAFT_379733 [Xylariaceae sp. FL0255]|nr:hypothetical protein F5Y16DRAFT_379733 [Xylariaceae sp. FL0255]